MRYILSIICILTFCFIGTLAYTAAVNKNPMRASTILIKAKPTDKSKVIETVSLHQRLIPIYCNKHGWLKVGNPRNGNVGWINTRTFHKPVKIVARPLTSSTYITINAVPDKNGKYKVVAYQNGQKLSEKASKKLFKQVKERQLAQQKQFKKMNQEMNKQFNQMMKHFNYQAAMGHMMHNTGNFPIIQPVVIMVPVKKI